MRSVHCLLVTSRLSLRSTVIPRLYKGAALKRILIEKLAAYRECINQEGQDRPEIRNWKWSLSD